MRDTTLQSRLSVAAVVVLIVVSAWAMFAPGETELGEAPVRWLGMILEPGVGGMRVDKVAGKAAQGLEPGDTIVGLNNTLVNGLATFHDAVNTADVSGGLVIDVWRRGVPLKVTLSDALALGAATSQLQPAAAQAPALANQVALPRAVTPRALFSCQRCQIVAGSPASVAGQRPLNCPRCGGAMAPVAL